MMQGYLGCCLDPTLFKVRIVLSITVTILLPLIVLCLFHLCSQNPFPPIQSGG